MKRMPFTINDWKAGGVPVTRSGVYVKQLTWFDAKNNEFVLYGVIDENLYRWHKDGKFTNCNQKNDYDLFLEIPCTKYYTHYYRYFTGAIISVTNQNSEPTGKSEFCTHIKTVEVEL